MNKQRMANLPNRFFPNDGKPSFSKHKGAALKGASQKRICIQSRRDLSLEPGRSRPGVKYLSVLIAIAFLLSACGSATATATPIVLPTDSPTATQTFTPALTLTSTPTLSPTITPTASITPLPTIATFTPTFDARTIVTATPATAAVCPNENNARKIDFLIPQNNNDITDPNLINDEKVLAFLNDGGSISTLLGNLQIGFMAKRYKYQDFTGDGIKDLMIRYFLGYGYTDIRLYTCIDGRYESFSAIEDNWPPLKNNTKIVAIKDLNKNSIPDIVIADEPAYMILEWQGSSFKRFLLMGAHSESRPGEIRDINNDGLDELILTGQEVYYYGFNESYYEGMPWRDEIRIFAWNGENYIQLPSEYSAPQYRFQAIQDGDRLTLQHKYEQAIELYQSAIFDDLGWWSSEMHAYEIGIPAAHANNQPTPTPPAPDPTEYPRLAAYAYYRMIALHVYLGEMDAATIQYNTLQQKFPAGDPGHPYVEMATALWDAYQSSLNMTTACAAAIEYAAEHPEILVPLGSDYHGWQSRIYVPADVCPFR